jgi:anaerobic ribonucleoside-triphosphate reductase
MNNGRYLFFLSLVIFSLNADCDIKLKNKLIEFREKPEDLFNFVENYGYTVFGGKSKLTSNFNNYILKNYPKNDTAKNDFKKWTDLSDCLHLLYISEALQKPYDTPISYIDFDHELETIKMAQNQKIMARVRKNNMHTPYYF